MHLLQGTHLCRLRSMKHLEDRAPVNKLVCVVHNGALILILKRVQRGRAHGCESDA